MGEEMDIFQRRIIVHFAEKELPNWGVICCDNGFVYLKIDDKYVHTLLPFIKKENFQSPPYFSGTDRVGAHITIIYPYEMAQYGITSIEEAGVKAYFRVIDCKIVSPPSWQEDERAYLVGVESSLLDSLRKKYGLPNKKYDFHITIGVRSDAPEKIRLK